LLLDRGPEDPVGGKSDSSVGEAQVGTENEEEEEDEEGAEEEEDEEGHATQLSGMESPSSIVLTSSSLIAG
jgi:hypothetical protein